MSTVYARMNTVRETRAKHEAGEISDDGARAVLNEIGFVAAAETLDFDSAMFGLKHLRRAHIADIKYNYERGLLTLNAVKEFAKNEHVSMLLHDGHVVPNPNPELMTDSLTGEVIEGCAIECDDEHRYADEENAHADGWRKCRACGSWVHVSDGLYIPESMKWFCGEECAISANYRQCAQCGEWKYAGPGTFGLLIADFFFCCESHAIDAGCERCEHCEEWTNDDYMTRVYINSHRTDMWCDDCTTSYTRECHDCGRPFDEDHMYYSHEECERFCSECYERRMNYGLHEYGYRPPIGFYGDAAKSPYLGVELETDGGCDRREYCCELREIEGFDDHFWMTKDSSLDNGVEITSMPCTLAYHVGLTPMYEIIRSTALHHGFRSHEGGRCGLHVHVNRDFFGRSVELQDLGGYKMMRLLQRFCPNFTRFSRRRDNEWCGYETHRNYAPSDPDEDVREVLSKAREMKYETNHSQALNFQHDATFEFRIFRGTLNLSTFFACLAMVNGIAHVAKQHSSYYVESVEWSDLMHDVVKACDEPTAREFLREYLEQREML